MAHALVTGASKGIGRATAIALSRQGDRVAIHYGKDRTGAEATLALMDGTGHALVGGDLRTDEGARRVFVSATSAVGLIDVLVNNAAVAPSSANAHPVATTDYAHWTSAWMSMLDVDLRAAANLSYLVARRLIDERRPGAIVNVGSRGAFRGEPDHPAYAAAKAGLHALGQSLAVALAPHGIQVTSVAPGFVATQRQEEKLEGPGGDAVRAQSPFGRVASPEEIAEVIVALTSPAAQWASGTIVDLNGASYLRS